MNTKIIVALVVGIVLVGLSGTASAAYYNLSANYVYADSAVNAGPAGLFTAGTTLYTEVTGYNPSNDATHMHSWIDNSMVVVSVSSPKTDVNFGLVQGGETHLTLETNLPGNMNTFVASDMAFQEINYAANGDAFDIYFYGDSVTHASTHKGILPIGPMALWDYNQLEVEVEASEYWNGVKWVPAASIKSGNIGYVCNTHGEATMEAEHVLGPVTAGSGIVAWSNADGEIWEPMGTISNDLEAYQQVYMWWPTP